MIEISKDKKSDLWIITKTDKEGFHRQLALSNEEMTSLCMQWASKNNPRVDTGLANSNDIGYDNIGRRDKK